MNVGISRGLLRKPYIPHFKESSEGTIERHTNSILFVIVYPCGLHRTMKTSHILSTNVNAYRHTHIRACCVCPLQIFSEKDV